MCTPARTCLRRFCRCRRTSSAPGSEAYACMHSQTLCSCGMICEHVYTGTLRWGIKAHACCCSWCQRISSCTNSTWLKTFRIKGSFRCSLGMFWVCQNITSGDVHTHMYMYVQYIHVCMYNTHRHRHRHRHRHWHRHSYRHRQTNTYTCTYTACICIDCSDVCAKLTGGNAADMLCHACLE